TIVLAQSPEALVIPTTAVRAENGGSACFCIANGKLVRKPVMLGLKSGKDVEVAAGLTGDDVIVEKVSAELKEGQAAEANPLAK
ncbi:MAG: hypothetical protein B7Z73_16715, partial [Planctomycetia bacterium 21-64-5]